VTVATLLLGYPVAYLMARTGGRLASLIAILVILPLWTSVLVRSFAWTVILQRNGLANGLLQWLGVTSEPVKLLYTEGAVWLAMTHVLLPFMILPVYGTLRGIPPELPRAARSLGAGSLATFRRVVLPLSLPGVAAGAVIVFTLSLGFFITPALVGGPTSLMLSTLIGQQATTLLNWPFAGALSMLLLVVTLALVIAFHRVLRLDRVIADGG
jgi:mannopine transport system permease protein